MNKGLSAIKPVYAYYFPETRGVVDSVANNYPHDLFLKSIFPGLDNFHEPIISKFLKVTSDSLPGLSTYKYSYPTSGSSEGLFKIMAHLKANDPAKPVYVLHGEYEGYKAYADSLGLRLSEISENDVGEVTPGYFFISNPSARDGNLLAKSLEKRIIKRHKVIYDLAYFGTTKPHTYDLSHKNIIAVVTSFSKQYGIFYHRIGFTFSKFTLPSLYGNKWFKNVLSLMIADKLLDKYPHGKIYKLYSKRKSIILKQVQKDTGINLRSSDALLLAFLTENDYENLSDSQKRLVSPFKRGNKYRFTLTPYFLAEEEKNEKHKIF